MSAAFTGDKPPVFVIGVGSELAVPGVQKWNTYSSKQAMPITNRVATLPSATLSVAALLIGLFIVGPAFSATATATAEPSESVLQDKEQELLTKRREIIEKTLELPPEIARRFWPIYDQFQADLSVVRAKRREILTDLGHGVDGMSEEEAKEYVLDKLEHETNRSRITREYFNKLARFMSYKTLATYIQVETKIRVYIEAGIEESIPLIR
jgi:hypothetical protein